MLQHVGIHLVGCLGRLTPFLGKLVETGSFTDMTRPMSWTA
ncbi:MAG TPA: hypothetical protein VMZ26_16100 [Pyrinomonadaceae bacterium]|nr:hypothetical protein [Pyrinomonadaceae bacterium]